MRKTVFLALFLAGMNCVAVAQTTGELMNQFIQSIRSAGSVETSFLWNNRVPGKMILQGEMFYIEMDEYQIYCNGTTKWFYNQGTDETTQTPHDTSSANILDNPASFFSRLNTDYYQPGTPGKKRLPSGEETWELTLIPNSVKAPFTYLVLSLSVTDLTPLYIRYSDTGGSEYSITLESFTKTQARPRSFFERKGQ
ncbi:MAG: outer membrane lipoprotein carrier protein LolA [Bacteroidales bacterium]|jgi:outer membrane lipoprotein-sorting protein|nr:outer membrane lipoprotein carrier protein LolA [Bacteroidales bacterium]